MASLDPRPALEADRALTQSQVEQLRRDLDEVFEATSGVATDDEHDPEGATIAYERSRVDALLRQAEAHLEEIALALRRLEAGSYGICLDCDRQIGAERLLSRPAVRTCIDCASRQRSR